MKKTTEAVSRKKTTVTAKPVLAAKKGGKASGASKKSGKSGGGKCK